MDKVDRGSRRNRPFNVNQQQPGPAEYAFSIIVGGVAVLLAGLLAGAVGHPMIGRESEYILIYPSIVGMNTLRARPETYNQNAFWGLRTLVYTLAIMAGAFAMFFMQYSLVRGMPQPWSGMMVYLVASYVVGLPLLLTTERTDAVRFRRSLLYVYPAGAIIIALAMWLFDVIFG